MTTKVTVDLKDAKKIVQDHGLAPGGKVQKFFTGEIYRLSDPYTPMYQGVLKNTATMGIDGTYIDYNTPDARYLWYGKLMVSPSTGSSWAKKNEQKVLTDIDLKYSEAPLRGSHWVERAYIDNKDKLLQNLEKFANRR